MMGHMSTPQMVKHVVDRRMSSLWEMVDALLKHLQSYRVLKFLTLLIQCLAGLTESCVGVGKNRHQIHLMYNLISLRLLATVL